MSMSIGVSEQAYPSWRRFTVTPKVAWQFARRKPLGGISALVLLLLVVMALFASRIAPYGPLAQNYDAVLAAPSWHHIMGTDQVGRDIFSRIIFGSRVSLEVGAGAVMLGTLGGAAIGVVSGYIGGQTDLVAQRFVDAWLAFPALIFLLTIIAALGPGLVQTIVAIGIGIVPGTSRVLRGAVLSVKQRDFIQAARASGAGNGRIMIRHIVPNVMPLIIVLSSITMAGAILAEATLGFLGVGIPPPTPTWGGMVSGNSLTYFLSAPWYAIWPGVFISVTVLAWNLAGDALRDILDPHLRSR